MSLLLAFEAAARHENYTRAAAELSLTQSAVSRQVQALEQQLGLTLFRREGRQVQLTDVGRLYQRELSEALGRIRSATLQALAYQTGVGTLRLATLPTFGSKWLLPRLHAFYSAHPGMLVHIHSRIEAINFDTSEIDAAIGVASHDLPGLICHRLHAEELVVILPPEAGGDAQGWSPARISEGEQPARLGRVVFPPRPAAPGDAPGAELRTDLPPDSGGAGRDRHRPGAEDPGGGRVGQGRVVQPGGGVCQPAQLLPDLSAQERGIAILEGVSQLAAGTDLKPVPASSRARPRPQVLHKSQACGDPVGAGAPAKRPVQATKNPTPVT